MKNNVKMIRTRLTISATISVTIDMIFIHPWKLNLTLSVICLWFVK